MRAFIYIIGLVMVLTGCGNSNQEITTDTNTEESAETTASSIDLANFETTLEVNQTKENVRFTINFQNKGEEAAQFTFSSGQKFEIVVTNEAGQKVYRFSEGKMFTMALETITLEAGETVTYEDVWDYKKDGELVDEGVYTVVAFVIPMEVNGNKLEKDYFKAEENFTVESLSSINQSTTEESQEESKSENPAFRNIKVTGEAGEYVITGEARVFEAVFMYSVEDGHYEIVKETPFFANEGAPAWSTFELKISIPENKLPEQGVLTARIYERSAKDGSIINSCVVTLEEF
ncbi:hypothetical protein JOC85_000557 [Bacillus mesophilus]|uniref:Intracellular proteinase inhibitor BsuPI domain-containing protein n=1 Tax=Bacillus mesophilus TaxID=1808955 RepID=A0A6M0Q4E5_9BACI|nr:BsuPI-related putative proteinase inhibitor [Bacillus mesophilus]MBM7659790.1 hypothetical protein [Bacillus mesophilus]NEY70649.1 hypothetical protein [Bacillus mesophilus]